MTAPAWDDLHAFLEVARRGSLPEAARALGTSAATVGRRLQRLEATLALPLFARHPNRLVLTPAGEELAGLAATMGGAAAAIAGRARTLAAPAGAPVRVTATGSLSLFLAAQAGRLAELSAGIVVTVVTTKTALDLAAGEADVALRMRRLPESGPLAGRRLGRVAFAVYAAHAVMEARRAADDWRGMEVVGLPEAARAPSQSRWLDDLAAARGATVRTRFGDVAIRHHAVRAGAGASLLPCFLGDRDPGLARLVEPPPELVEDLYLLLHERGRESASVRAVVEALATIIREEADALAGEARAGQPAIAPGVHTEGGHDWGRESPGQTT